MNKAAISLLIIISIIVLQSLCFLAFAENMPSEMQMVKIIVDGKQFKDSNPPIMLDNRVFVPLRSYLSRIGVINDNEHIIWNDSNKSVTIYKDKKKINLKINDHKAYVDESEVYLDVAPVMYKDKTYIPLRFIAENFDKVVAWDSNLLAIAICDKNQYNYNKSTLSKVFRKLEDTNKYRMVLSGSIQSSAHIEAGGLYNGEIQVDKTKDNIVHRVWEHTVYLNKLISKNECYFANGYQYELNNGKWDKKIINSANLDFTYIPVYSLYADIVYASLVHKDYTNALQFTGELSIIKTFPNYFDSSFKGTTLISINKETNMLTSISSTGTAKIPSGVTNYAGNFSVSFDKMYDSFSIDLPESIKNDKH